MTSAFGQKQTSKMGLTMKMSRGVDYLFYRVYSYQLKPWNGVPIFAAHIGIYAVTLAVGLNITTLLFAINLELGGRYLRPDVGIAIFFGLFAFFYFYFVPGDRYKKIVKEFASEPHADRIRNGFALWSYCFATIVLLFFSVSGFRPAR